MTKSDVQIGACVRVIIDRWDVPVGTLARVESIGHVGVTQDWCFTVEWLNRTDQRDRHRHTSLNLFEGDLKDFEIYTGPIEQPDRNPKQQRAMIPQPTTEQLCLPYGRDDSVSDGPADRYFRLRSRPAWDFDVDL